MWKLFRHNRSGGATIEYALFLSAVAIALLSITAIVGNELRPQLVAWQKDQAQIDETLTGSIVKQERETGNTKVYRVFQLPEGLRKKQND